MRIAAGWVNSLSLPINSDQESEEHKWLGMSPVMREHIGPRLVHLLRDFGIKITNKDFEATIEVLLSEIRRDKTKQVMTRVNDLAARANSHGAKLLSDLILNGASTVCYDGQFFFDTDHVDGSSGTQSNKITTDISALAVPTDEQGSTTDPGVKTMQKVILLAIQQMLGFKDDQGEPMNEAASEFLVMVPTSLWATALNAISAGHFGGGENNVLANFGGFNISLLANPRLTWTDQISVFRADMGDGVKPFIKQEEVPLNILAQAEHSPEEFHKKRHLYSIDWVGNYGYGFWQHAVTNQMT